MSHFTVICIGDVETNMERFNEQDDDFFEHIPSDDDYLGEYEKHKSDEGFLNEYPNGTFEEFLDWWCGKKLVYDDNPSPDCGYVRMKEGKIVEAMDYYNPNSVYDYYQGGWNGLITKDGNETNHALKKDVDFPAMIKRNEQENREEYRNVLKACNGVPIKGMITWKSLLKRKDDGEISIDEAREIYNNQDAIKEFDKNKKNVFGTILLGWDFNLEDFDCTEDEYCKKNPPCLCYGLVKDETYYSKGKVGWWGLSADKLTTDEWSKQVFDLLESLDDEEEITILDCHI